MIVICLDRLLAQHKMQSAELAREIDCTVQTVSRIKTGKVKSLSLGTLDALCECFGCQPGDVLEYMTEEEGEKRFGSQFVDEYRELHSPS